MFANVSDICKRMHRPPEHAIQYLFDELGTTGSIDGAGRLIIRGKFQQKQIENVLRHYISKCDCLTLTILPLTELRYAHCSGIRCVQDVQIPRYPSYEGKPYLLRLLRIVRFKTFSQCHQDRFPGAGREESKKQDRLEESTATHSSRMYPYSAFMYNLHMLSKSHHIICHVCLTVLAHPTFAFFGLAFRT